jgi:hypothetical protein
MSSVAPLISALRNLWLLQDDERRIRRTINLAAARADPVRV